MKSIFAGLVAWVMMLVSFIPLKPSDKLGDAIKEARPPVESAAVTRDEAMAKGGGWYVTMDENFDGDALPENWTTSPHAKRNTEWWCADTVSVGAGQASVLCYKEDNHVCSAGVCPAQGVFTGGIETRKMVDGKSVNLFEQAFGYFECRVMIPKGEGLWAAFWLQSPTQGNIGNQGRDGSEIDVFESVFANDPTLVGSALNWDGYHSFYQSHGTRYDTGVNLYEGWHTYGVLWTPVRYVFFVDGKPTFETNADRINRTPNFLRLTVESRPAGTVGPYGYTLGDMTATKDEPAVFSVDWVRVYQNTAFEPHIKAATDFANINKPWIATVLGWFGKTL
ncbi:MAG: glycoside hydrolase family 16 protein [Oscillospiraceae bacterium]|jgi:hypothetical protein|nr:glycoside hydrolase family 16 protein [Oscillospiraceae bacterium]